MDRFVFDKEFKERLNTVSITAYQYFKIKVKYEEALEELHLFLNKQQKETKTTEGGINET